jgi:hypothetical protein
LDTTPLGHEQIELQIIRHINEECGSFIDRKLLDLSISLDKQQKALVGEALFEATKGAVGSPDERDKILACLAARNCDIPNLKKTTVQKYLGRDDLHAEARKLLELRAEGAPKSKAEGILRNLDPNTSRIFHTMVYAGTGRLASHAPNLQNLHREEGDMAGKVRAVLSGDVAQIATFGPVRKVIASCARALVAAPPGYRLFIIDFSSIEYIDVAWLAGEQHVLDAFSQGKDPYLAFGIECVGNVPYARDFGKAVILPRIYGVGEGRLRESLQEKFPDLSPDIDVWQFIKLFDERHPRIKSFWAELLQSALAAIEQPGREIACRKVTFLFHDKFLIMRLPSGRYISYPFARIGTREGFRGPEEVLIFKENRKKKRKAADLDAEEDDDDEDGLTVFADCRSSGKLGFWGGPLCENATQGTSRDGMLDAVVRLISAGYRVNLTVHDEIIAEVPDDFGALEDFKRIAEQRPDWAPDRPVTCKARSGPRLAKGVDVPVDAPARLGDWSHVPLHKTKGPAEPKAKSKKRAHPRGNGDPGKDDPGAGADDSGNDDRNTDGYPHGEQEKGQQQTDRYVYRDARGQPYQGVKRMVGPRGKTFPQYHWDGKQWVKGLPKGFLKIPFRLPELLDTPPDHWTVIAAGEKDALTAVKHGFCGTTNPCGEGKGQWTPELNKWFAGRKRVAIMEDNDPTGYAHVVEVAKALRGIVPIIKIVQFRELPEHGDLTDWMEADPARGHKELLARIEAARPAVGYELIKASTVTGRIVHWLWPGHLACGELEILTGIPDIGKSQIHCFMVACITKGRDWPDGAKGMPPRSVVMLTAEDNMAHTLIPRLTAAGANLDRVNILNRIHKDNRDRMFLLQEDVEELEQILRDNPDIALVTIDPITAYLGGGKHFDSHRATDVRNQLGPLKDLAERTGCGFSAITHPAKRPGAKALDHYIGSQAFIAAPRLGHIAIPEFEEGADGQPQPTGRYLYATPKHNIYREMPTLAYKLVEASVGGRIHNPTLAARGRDNRDTGNQRLHAHRQLPPAPSTTARSRCRSRRIRTYGLWRARLSAGARRKAHMVRGHCCLPTMRSPIEGRRCGNDFRTGTRRSRSSSRLTGCTTPPRCRGSRTAGSPKSSCRTASRHRRVTSTPGIRRSPRRWRCSSAAHWKRCGGPCCGARLAGRRRRLGVPSAGLRCWLATRSRAEGQLAQPLYNGEIGRLGKMGNMLQINLPIKTNLPKNS